MTPNGVRGYAPLGIAWLHFYHPITIGACGRCTWHTTETIMAYEPVLGAAIILIT